MITVYCANKNHSFYPKKKKSGTRNNILRTYKDKNSLFQDWKSPMGYQKRRIFLSAGVKVVRLYELCNILHEIRMIIQEGGGKAWRGGNTWHVYRVNNHAEYTLWASLFNILRFHNIVRRRYNFLLWQKYTLFINYRHCYIIHARWHRSCAW